VLDPRLGFASSRVRHDHSEAIEDMHMARYEQSSRPKRKTPAERSVELMAASRLLKEESAERRAKAAETQAKPPSPGRARRA
jgi:hypothetical protein